VKGVELSRSLDDEVSIALGYVTPQEMTRKYECNCVITELSHHETEFIQKANNASDK
jgi:hypothetical protein